MGVGVGGHALTCGDGAMRPLGVVGALGVHVRPAEDEDVAHFVLGHLGRPPHAVLLAVVVALWIVIVEYEYASCVLCRVQGVCVRGVSAPAAT